MTRETKHTVYIDVDDEITSIIEKVKSTPERIVALVLPKRATVLQSIVNMKLLKKSATHSKKSLVLITSEAGLMPLAGVVGLHVAKSLQSKPAIPPAPDRSETSATEVTDEDEEPSIDKTRPIGDLATAASVVKDDDGNEVIEIDNVSEIATSKDSPAKKLAKRFKVPNFDKFRIGFFLSILGVILLVFGWVMAAVVMPSAVVTITTDTTTINASVSFTANTAVQTLDLATAQVPAVAKEVKKTDTEKTTATGKKDKGDKATGTVTIRNCDYSDSFTIASGSTFTASGKSFVSTESVVVPKFTGPASSCTLPGGSSGKATVNVQASGSGPSYNLSAQQYSVPGVASGSKVDGQGSAMTGGTSNFVTVVSQDDVDKAVAKMKGRLDQEATTELNALLKVEDLTGLDETRVTGAPVVKATPGVDAEASGEVTVTAETTYSVLGVKQDYLSQLIKKDASTKIDTTRQSISDDGLETAAIRLEARKSPTEAQMNIQSLVTAGPELNEATIKDQIRGKKKGDVEKLIGSLPGVKDVTVQYKPFWVFSTPKATKKIKIVIEKPVVKEETITTNGDNSTP